MINQIICGIFGHVVDPYDWDKLDKTGPSEDVNSTCLRCKKPIRLHWNWYNFRVAIKSQQIRNQEIEK